MKHWIDTYPHKVYASVLLLNNKMIDYKIGERYWESPFHVTLRGQMSFDDLFKCETRYTYWEVNTPEEHDEVFDSLAKTWIEKQMN